MTLHRPAGTLTSGPDPIRLTAQDAGWDHCGLHVLALTGGRPRRLDLQGLEAAVVPLHGGCTVRTDGFEIELHGRPSPFEAVTDLCYVPLDADVELIATADAEVAVATAVADEARPPRYYPADGVEVSVRGAGQASRQINGLLDAGVDGPQRLLVVEVLTPDGNWSSYPPHKHDEHSDAELPLEEIYYFRVRGEGGFAAHRTYTLDGDIDETVTIRDGDVFLVPRGFHGPCMAAPGYDLYYLNVMAGPSEERGWRFCTDPSHAWLWDAWAGAPTDPRLPMTGSRSAP